MIRPITQLDSHHRLLWSLGTTLAGFFLLRNSFQPSTLLISLWDIFALTDLALTWTMIFRNHPQEIRRTAKLQDSSRTFLFIVVVAAAYFSLMTVGFLLGPSKVLPEAHKTGHIVLSILAVLCSWFLMHTVFSLRYAHFFYSASEKGGSHIGGLEFPGEQHPDFLDFAYFSFVIGMTFQVSDVQIKAKRIRRLVLLHGMLSFGFNTIILALAINVILSVY